MHKYMTQSRTLYFEFRYIIIYNLWITPSSNNEKIIKNFYYLKFSSFNFDILHIFLFLYYYFYIFNIDKFCNFSLLLISIIITYYYTY